MAEILQMTLIFNWFSSMRSVAFMGLHSLKLAPRGVINYIPADGLFYRRVDPHGVMLVSFPERMRWNQLAYKWPSYHPGCITKLQWRHMSCMAYKITGNSTLISNLFWLTTKIKAVYYLSVVRGFQLLLMNSCNKGQWRGKVSMLLSTKVWFITVFCSVWSLYHNYLALSSACFC